MMGFDFPQKCSDRNVEDDWTLSIGDNDTECCHYWASVTCKAQCDMIKNMSSRGKLCNSGLSRGSVFRVRLKKYAGNQRMGGNLLARDMSLPILASRLFFSPLSAPN